MQTPDRAWLEGGGVEVWIAEPREHGVDTWLGAAEQARAGRFALPEARARFVTARALARWGLAHLTGLAPDALPLYELPSGKPVIGV